MHFDNNPFPSEIEFECKQLIDSFLSTGEGVVLQRIPSYCGFYCNEQADLLAKVISALHLPCSPIPLRNAKWLLNNNSRQRRISTTLHNFRLHFDYNYTTNEACEGNENLGRWTKKLLKVLPISPWFLTFSSAYFWLPSYSGQAFQDQARRPGLLIFSDKVVEVTEAAIDSFFVIRNFPYAHHWHDNNNKQQQEFSLFNAWQMKRHGLLFSIIRHVCISHSSLELKRWYLSESSLDMIIFRLIHSTLDWLILHSSLSATLFLWLRNAFLVAPPFLMFVVLKFLESFPILTLSPYCIGLQVTLCLRGRWRAYLYIKKKHFEYISVKKRCSLFISASYS